MADILIRPARIEDATGIFETQQRSIRELCGRDYTPSEIDGLLPPTLSAESHAKNIAEGDRDFLVAELDGTIAGFAAIRENKISLFYVHPDHLYKGAGKALFNAIETRLIEQGYKTIMVTSSITARDFYQKMGMQVIETIRHCLNSGVELTAIEMEKSVAGE